MRTSLEQACQRASRRCGWLSVVVRREPLPLSCAEVLAGQRAGTDPTGPWRAACAADFAAQHHRSAHPALPPTFVLQWYLGAIAQVGAQVALAAPCTFPLSANVLSMRLAGPGAYPVQVAVDPVVAELAVPASDPDERLGAAQECYREHAQEFLDGFAPGVKLSSLHRWGSVRDAWDSAVSAADPTRPLPRWRTSCCYIYDVPGAHECARCPRLR